MLLTDCKNQYSSGTDRYIDNAGVVTNSVVYSVELIPNVHKQTVKLSASVIIMWEAQTNFVAGVHAQIPYGQTLLMLDGRQSAPTSHRMAFLLEVDENEYKPDGNTPEPIPTIVQ